MALDGLAIHFLVRELNDRFAGGRLDKITQPNGQSVVLSVRQPGSSRQLYISISAQCQAAYEIDRVLENPTEAPLFCMVLRKQIETGRIAAVRQQQLDRIIIIDIDFLASGGRIVTKSLIIELMGKYSNLILVKDGTIIDSMRHIGANNSRVRRVLPGLSYELPPQQNKLDIFRSPLSEVLDQIRQLTELRLTKAVLAVCQGFGPVSAKEAVHAAGFAQDFMTDSMDEKDLQALSDTLAGFCKIYDEGKSRACVCYDERHRIKAMAAFALTYPEGQKASYDTVSLLLDAVQQTTGSYVPPERDRLAKLIHTEQKRSANKQIILQEEAKEAHNAEEYKQKADTLMTWQYSLQDRVDKELELADIYSTDGHKVKIAMNQRLTVSQNIQAYYHKYDKLKRAQQLLQEQLATCQAESAYLDSVENSLNLSVTTADIEEIKAELVKGGYIAAAKKKKMAGKVSQPHKFQTKNFNYIFVGKNNSQNDRLTFKIANSNDIWLHTQDIPGSHVILRLTDGVFSEEDLQLAARLAAGFSKAADSSQVAVDYVLCRYVKKPAGAKPGFVIFTHNKTLYVTPSVQEIENLLRQDVNA